MTTRGISATINGRTIQLGRHLLELDNPDFEVDHIDRNFLNFKIDNLRISTRTNNQHNKRGYGASSYKGVVKRDKKWQAQIRKDGRYYYLGLHETEEGAAKAHDLKAIELYGEFASLNFPQEMRKV